jgi:hypothetical protein
MYIYVSAEQVSNQISSIYDTFAMRDARTLFTEIMQK